MKRVKPVLRFALLSASGFAVVLALVWTMVSRETQRRSLDIEYEAFRVSANVQEAFRLDPSYVPENPSIIGYGIYNSVGKAIRRSGTAPDLIDLASVASGAGSRLAAGPPPSVILFRPLGFQGGAGSGLGGMGMIPGMGRGMGRRGANGTGLAPGSLPGQTGRQPESPADEPHFLWLQYSSAPAAREATLLAAGAGFLTAALIALYWILIALYRHNYELRAKQLHDRELVQLGEAARTLVHEIKNPLGIIRIQAATLRKTGATPSGLAAADVIEDEVLRLAGLADRIREFLQSGEGLVEEIDLVPWLDAYVSRYRGSGEGGEVLGLSLPDGVSRALVQADAARLTSALDNLVKNAFDADSPGGERSDGERSDGEQTRDEMPGQDRGRPEILLRRGGHLWEISVCDRGPGVPPENVEKIFEPFFTTKTKGTGIGLALARRVVESAGGTLEYSDRPGGGSSFAIRLPEASEK